MPKRFELGRVVITRNAQHTLGENYRAQVLGFIDKHVAGDWGDVPPEDKHENELSVEHGFRILSEYRSRQGDRVWVITEADRSATTILLPEDY